MSMIHKFSMNGYNIVLDVNGGAVHVVDEVAYNLVDLYKEKTKEEIIESLKENYTVEQINEAYDEIKTLEEEGLLYTEDTYQFHPSFVARKKVVKALCLHVAHDCNLKCKYCFAAQGDFGGEKQMMSFEVGKAAIDYLIANSGNRRNLEIDFFGGGPLMNFDVVKQLVEYGRSIEKENNKNMKFEKLVPSVFYVNLKDSLKLFVECLEFSIVHEEFESESPYYVIEKDGLGMLLFQNNEYAEKDYPEFRLVTKNIEEVYEKVISTHPELLHPNLNKITLRPWGAKEFALKDEQVGIRIQEW